MNIQKQSFVVNLNGENNLEQLKKSLTHNEMSQIINTEASEKKSPNENKSFFDNSNISQKIQAGLNKMKSRNSIASNDVGSVAIDGNGWLNELYFTHKQEQRDLEIVERKILQNF